MLSMERPFTMLSSYKKELWALLSGMLALMAVIALYSFDPQDPSWFFVSSSPQPVHNWCGVVGSYFSGLLMFLFGSASYLVVALTGALIYWVAVDGEWKEHWERIIAGMGVVACVATLCTLHKLEIVPHGMYGGYVGYYVTAVLYTLFDTVGSLILVYATLYASLVLLLRFSFMQGVQSLARAARSVYAWAVRHRVGHRLYAAATYSFFALYRAATLLFRSLLELVDDRPQPPAEMNNQSQEVRGLYPPRLIPLNRPTHIGVARQSHTQHDEQELESIESYEQQECDFIDESHVAATRPRDYGLPSQDIFIGIQEKKGDELYRQELEDRARILEEKLERFGVCGKVISIKNGPVVTLFEYEPDIDTKISKILALEDDLSLALQAHSIRILAPIPGRSVVGFEVSNQDRKDVLLAGVVQSQEYDQFSGYLPLILGKDTIGENVVVDLAKMPHLLIAGSTGSGKSVALNAMLISLLCKQTPDELKLILIDPKRLEFSTYADIAHLLFPIVTDPRKSIPILRWVVQQMEKRYEQMATHGVRNIFDYNKLAANQELEHFPFIVVVIDELSDLMLTVGREIEDLITRIAQMARAAGIHMIVATQRPSVDVITGLIKVNFPSRISFRVTSKVDSRTILDCGGADKLLGRGDMLFLDSTASSLKRIHGAYVSDEQIEMVVSHIRSQQTVEYLDISEDASLDSDVSPEDEELFKDIISFIGQVDEVSISLLQRKFKIGYNRSARIIDMLESRGLIMPADGGKTRRVIR
jgi:DNA segregation ATPase FtsK/SpoIIIE, S-DNA-T family